MARGSVSGQRVFLKPAAAATGSSRQQPAAGSSRQQAAAGSSRQQQAAAGSSQQQPAPASSTQHAGAGSGRQQQAAAGSRAAAVAVAAAKFQFYSRVSEVTLSPFLGFLCYVLGTKLGGVLLFRMCFEKGVWLFVSCFGSCLIAAAPQQQQQPPAAAPAAGSSREQQAAAGSSRQRQQQAAAGSSRQQQAAGSSRQAAGSRQAAAAGSSSRYAAGMQSWQGDCRCAACTSCVWALGLGLELPAWCFEPEFCNLFYSKLTTVLVIDLWRPTWGCTSSRIANISGPSKQGHKTWAARLSEHKWFRSQLFHVSNSHISRPVWFMPIYMVCTKYHTHFVNIDKQTHLHVESCRISLVHVQ